MCKRLIAVLAIVFFAHRSGAEKRAVTCKTPAIAPSCYWTHGRLAVYNGGYPNLRLWKIGTHNLLGIYSGPSEFLHREDYLSDHPEGDDSELPANLEAAFNIPNPFTIEVYADFEVCPLERHIEGHMQAACIESAKHLVITK
jgi:hypothetical protein